MYDIENNLWEEGLERRWPEQLMRRGSADQVRCIGLACWSGQGPGCECYVTQQRVALASVEGNRFIPERCGQNQACNAGGRP